MICRAVIDFGLLIFTTQETALEFKEGYTRSLDHGTIKDVLTNDIMHVSQSSFDPIIYVVISNKFVGYTVIPGNLDIYFSFIQDGNGVI